MKHETLDRSARKQRFGALALLAFVTSICVVLAFTQKLLGDGDVFWHLAAGEYILHTGSIPTADPFSYTAFGRPWHAHEWLAEVLMAGAFGTAGWSGVVLLYSLAGGVTAWLIGRELLKRVPVRWALCALFVICMLLQPLAVARPHMLAWLLLTVWTLALMRGRPPLAALPIMAVWANLHASYILGLGIAAAFAAEGVLRDRSTALRWAGFLAAALICACLTPQGPQGFLYPFQVSGMEALGVINEWRPTNARDDRLFLIFTACAWALVALRWRELHPVRILLLAGLTVLAVSHARHQMPLVIVASLILPPLLGKAEAPPVSPPWPAVIPVAIVLLVVRLIVPFQAKDSAVYPKSAMAALSGDLRAKRVFNGYSFGGPLIQAGIRPYIDGRADIYGDAFTLDYAAMLRGDIGRFRAAEQRWGFGWTILSPGDGLVNRLDHEPGWKRFYYDRYAVVHVRAR